MVLLGGVAATDAAAQTVTLSVPQGTSLAEGAGNTDIIVTATLSASRASDTTVTLSLGGTARAADYRVVGSLPVITIQANQNSGSATLVLSPVDDNFYEGDETIAVNGSAGGLTVVGASAKLEDNETKPTVNLSAAQFANLTEGSGTSGVARIALTVAGATFEDDFTFTIDVYEGSSPSTTTAGSGEYTVVPVLPSTLTLQAGLRSVMTEFTFSPVDDDDDEFQERVSLYAAATFMGVEIQSNDAVAAVINDDDVSPRVSVDMSPREMDSDAPPTNVTVNLRMNTALSESVTFTITPEAPRLDWFQPESLTIALPTGSTSGTGMFTVTPEELTALESINFVITWDPATVEIDWVRLFFVGGRISLCGSEAGGNWIRHGVVREQRRGPVADGTCAVSDGWGCSAGTRALGGGSQYASMRRRPVAA